MDKYEYNGETYYYNNGKWLTSSRIKAPLVVVNKLNQLIVADLDVISMSLEELLKMYENVRESGNMQLITQILELAIKKANLREISMILPILISNYTKMGKSQEAVHLGEMYISKYKKTIGTMLLYTSLAVAYCDVEDYVKGKKYADLAKAWAGGKIGQELIGVYICIKQHCREVDMLTNQVSTKKKTVTNESMIAPKIEEEVIVENSIILEENKKEELLNCDISVMLGNDKYNLNVKCEVRQLLEFLANAGENNWGVMDLVEKEENEEEKAEGNAEEDEVIPYGDGLYDRLRTLRLRIAKEEGLTSFCIFKNSTLKDMADRAPKSKEEMLKIKGVGPQKYARYGARFLTVITDYLSEKE